MNTGKFSYLVKQILVSGLGLIAVVLSNPVFSADPLPISQSPLAVESVAAPRVMLAMSRDHQLFIKAYTDYTDLNNDGILDTTYNNNVDYYGYFDSKKCYTYGSGLFEPSGFARGHQCTSQWSGNFLNWATMTRMDLIRKVLYGGYRSTDDGSDAGGSTVLERTMIPYDLHAFAKVFKSADMENYTPYTDETITICNLTQGSGLSKNIDTRTYPPLMRVAKGSVTAGIGWPGWAASKNIQCQWRSNNNGNNNNTLPGTDDNLVDPGDNDGLIVRVKVCVSGLEETTCKSYTDPATDTITKKPTGLLQKYWDIEKPISFGLMSGSWGKSKKGGVLRKALPTEQYNTGEVVQSDGTFFLEDNAKGGIISTLDRFRISDYDFDDKEYKHCDTEALLDKYLGEYKFEDGECVDWGNPLSEIYLETLRYLAGKRPVNSVDTERSATPAFDTDDSSYVPSVIPPSARSNPLDQKAWYDPIGEGSWCARCSIVVISTGLNTFDTDQLAGNDLGIDAVDKTNYVGSTLEGLSGNYQIGDIFGSTRSSDHDKQCTGKPLANLADARGICPEVPSQEGGYHIAGLAYYARTHDFRTTITGNGEASFTGDQSINTYSVALAESLPHFDIPVGTGTITLLPACLANSTANADSGDSGWRSCSMTDLVVESLTYVIDNGGNYILDENGKKQVSGGSFTIIWEDSTWGSNYDMDGKERLAFCVGSACDDDDVSAGQIKITTSLIQAESDHSMQFGYTISGSDGDGVALPILRHGNGNNPLPGASSRTYSYRNPSAKRLENPLWYAAKYGGFDTIDSSVPIGQQTPRNQSWDEDGNEIPDAFFKATNPVQLENSLDEILSNISSKSASSASVAANSTRLDTTAALYQAKFNPSRWNGQLLAYQIDSTSGSLAETPAWDASEKMTAQGFSGRQNFIFSYNDVNKNGIIFDYNNLSDDQKGSLDEINNSITSNYNTLSDTQKKSVKSDQLNYIKGEQVNEKPAGSLRQRIGPNRLMGDIINSDPEFISSISQGYDSLPGEEGSDYLRYITSSKYRERPPMLAVGANDGMLHVFNASLCTEEQQRRKPPLCTTEDNGEEIMAYVPSTIIPKLPALTLPSYIVEGNHQFFVDGSPNAADAYFNADGPDNEGDKEWRTALVGTLGAGGKGVFALDLTFLDPDDYNSNENEEHFSASRVLWEINDQMAPEANDLTDDLDGIPARYGFTNHLGVTMGQASIVRMANGKFAAVFGNGYNSGKDTDGDNIIDTGQTAVLYIVNIKTGKLIRSISTGAGPTVSAPENINGLATPLTVDANGDHIVDAIYAGDYLGNMWKFDVSDSHPENWDVAFASGGSPAPLFKAMSSPYATPNPFDINTPLYTPVVPQKITAKPEFGKHPNGGIMLYFGTGKYFLRRDNLVDVFSEVETFYAIWDECVKYAGGTGSCSNVPVSGKAELQQQTIDYEAVKSNFNVRVTSGNSVDYATKKGWYMDLYKGSGNANAEKVISQAILRNRRIIFPTIIPARGECSFGGTSWLMMVDALTGKNLDTTAFDLTGSGTFTDGQITYANSFGVEVTRSVSGIQSKVGMIDTPAVIETDSNKEKLVGSGSSGETEQYDISKLPGGRQSWVQIR